MAILIEQPALNNEAKQTRPSAAKVLPDDDIFDLQIKEIEAAAAPSSGLITIAHIDNMVKAAVLKSPRSVKELRETLINTLMPKKWEPEDYLELRGGGDLDRGAEIIEGILRDGEVGFICSASKAGKSWLVGNLIWAAISGQPWLGKNVKQGKVLLIDNELKRREIDWRNNQIALSMRHQPSEGELTVISRRGQDCDINKLSAALPSMDWPS